MESYKFDKGQVTDNAVIIFIWRVIQNMRTQGIQNTNECIENQQKLLHLSLGCMEKKSIKALPFNISQQAVKFIQKINRNVMQHFKNDKEEVNVKIFSKCVDLLMIPYLHKYMQSQRILDELKILTFNNLACIYKQKKMLPIALRAVSFALSIEEALVNGSEDSNQQKYNIITTYLNKAAILSQMNKHQKAIEEIQKSKRFIDKIQVQVLRQIQSADDPNLKDRLEQKKYYGLYMKMIINYNMGAEKEHLKLLQSAKEYYKQGKQFAIIIQNTYMVKKFDNILLKLR